MKRIIPQNGRVLLQVTKEDEKIVKGIIVPNEKEDRYLEATVVVSYSGDKGYFESGQVVFIDRYAGSSVKIDDQDYLIMKAEDILAVVEIESNKEIS